MQDQGFFQDFVKKVAIAINAKFSPGLIIDVRNVRNAMNISPDDRSKIIFMSRALDKLAAEGFLNLELSNSHKHYKILGKIKME